MRDDKKEIERLRMRGMSYKEISKRMKVPVSTLSGWFQDQKWSQLIKERLQRSSIEQGTVRMRSLNKARGGELARLYEQAKEEALAEFGALKYNPLFITGIMLYWGEGDKLTKSVTKLTNTDPQMIRLFSMFLREACGLPKEYVRASLLLYPDNDKAESFKFWADSTQLESTQFRGSTVIQGKHKTRRLKNGICLIYVSSSYFKVKMLAWLDLLPKELMMRAYYESI